MRGCIVKMLQKIEKAITDLASTLSAVGVIIITSIIFLNVIMRHFFNNSMVWVEEFTRYIMMWVAFIGASLAVKNNMHVSMDALFNVFSDRVKRVVCIFIYSIAGLTTLGLIFLGIGYASSLVKTHQVSIALDWFPMWIVYVCVPIGCLFMTLLYWHLVFKNISGKKYAQSLEVGEKE